MVTFSASDSQHLVAVSLELVIHGFDRPPTAMFLDELAMLPGPSEQSQEVLAAGD
jgi:hypothetical protein